MKTFPANSKHRFQYSKHQIKFSIHILEVLFEKYIFRQYNQTLN